MKESKKTISEGRCDRKDCSYYYSRYNCYVFPYRKIRNKHVNCDAHIVPPEVCDACSHRSTLTNHCMVHGKLPHSGACQDIAIYNKCCGNCVHFRGNYCEHDGALYCKRAGEPSCEHEKDCRFFDNWKCNTSGLSVCASSHECKEWSRKMGALKQIKICVKCKYFQLGAGFYTGLCKKTELQAAIFFGCNHFEENQK